MKIKLLTILAILLTSGFVFDADAKSHKEEKAPPHHERMHKDFMGKKEKMLKELNLTQEQKEKAEELKEKAKKDLKPLMEEMKELREKMDEIREQNKEEFEAILTPEQKEKLESLAKEGRKGRKGKKGEPHKRDKGR